MSREIKHNEYIEIGDSVADKDGSLGEAIYVFPTALPDSDWITWRESTGKVRINYRRNLVFKGRKKDRISGEISEGRGQS